MTSKRSSSDLYHRVAFEERAEIDRGDGVKAGGWVSRFSVRAGFVHLRGGESVMTGRLAGQHAQIIFVRTSMQTLDVTTEWRIRDERTGTFFNIRDITPGDDRLWLDFLVQSGVNPG